MSIPEKIDNLGRLETNRPSQIRKPVLIEVPSYHLERPRQRNARDLSKGTVSLAFEGVEFSGRALDPLHDKIWNAIQIEVNHVRYAADTT